MTFWRAYRFALAFLLALSVAEAPEALGALPSAFQRVSAVYESPAHAPRVEPPASVMDLQSTFEKIARDVKPAVVSISTVQIGKEAQTPEFFFGDPFEQFFEQFGGPGPGGPAPHRFRMEGLGSGVIIDPSGLVLTNEHVVHDANQIKVVVYRSEGQQTEYTGHVVGKDLQTDLAVVRIHAREKLPFVGLGDSDQVKVGDWSIAIGSPFGLEQTVTAGIISAARQALQIEGHTYEGLIQTDAAINRGNSGGPLLNIHGEVIGINTAIYAPTGVFSGVGFAVPINQAKDILNQLIRQGHVVRGWLGVELASEITPAMVRAFGLPNEKGALVNDVLPNSPAQKAGLKRGDVIVAFDGRPATSSIQLQTLVGQTQPKTAVPVEIWRDGRRQRLTLKLGERPANAEEPSNGGGPSPGGAAAPSQSWSWEGAEVASATPDLLDNAGQPANVKGVIVMNVKLGSGAEEAGLLAGDLIRAVNQQPTPDLAAFKSAAAKVDLKQGVVLDVLREGHPLFLSYTAS